MTWVFINFDFIDIHNRNGFFLLKIEEYHYITYPNILFKNVMQALNRAVYHFFVAVWKNLEPILEELLLNSDIERCHKLRLNHLDLDCLTDKIINYKIIEICSNRCSLRLTHFMPLVFFYTSWKNQKTRNL